MFYIIGLLFYIFVVVNISVMFSISLCSSINSYNTNNFECGFYSIMLLIMKYKFVYWIILLHFMIFEQELMICMMMMYGGNCSINWMLVFLSLLMLFSDLLILLESVINSLYLFYLKVMWKWYIKWWNINIMTNDFMSTKFWSNTIYIIIYIIWFNFSFIFIILFNLIMLLNYELNISMNRINGMMNALFLLILLLVSVLLMIAPSIIK